LRFAAQANNQKLKGGGSHHTMSGVYKATAIIASDIGASDVGASDVDTNGAGAVAAAAKEFEDWMTGFVKKLEIADVKDRSQEEMVAQQEELIARGKKLLMSAGRTEAYCDLQFTLDGVLLITDASERGRLAEILNILEEGKNLLAPELEALRAHSIEASLEEKFPTCALALIRKFGDEIYANVEAWDALFISVPLEDLFIDVLRFLAQKISKHLLSTTIQICTENIAETDVANDLSIVNAKRLRRACREAAAMRFGEKASAGSAAATGAAAGSAAGAGRAAGVSTISTSQPQS
jgi:hypothetical protein